MMEILRVVLKTLMWVLIAGFGCNFVMQTVSYSFYKGAKQMENIDFIPEHIQFSASLTGYGYNLNSTSDHVILFFGGSNYIAYNSTGQFGGTFDCPFISADYYGSQNSKGKMNLHSMQDTAADLYDWAETTYPKKKIIVIGHSYGTGIATYLASVRDCDGLVLLAAYRDLSDLYNRIIPIFWGPAKAFISNNIRLADYAQNVTCDTYIIGSNADKTLDAKLQYQVKECFSDASIAIFDDVPHEGYFKKTQVIEYIRTIFQ